MAEGLLRHRIAQERLGKAYEVFSTGVWALDGRGASDHSVTVLAERGIDISDHVARSLEARDVVESDLILVMSREHRDVILSTWPQYAWKVFLLSEMVGLSEDVRDPYGGPIEEYRVCADTLSHYITEGWEQILSLV
jgi:protein-tyrosine-phosphatase